MKLVVQRECYITFNTDQFFWIVKVQWIIFLDDLVFFVRQIKHMLKKEILILCLQKFKIPQTTWTPIEGISLHSHLDLGERVKVFIRTPFHLGWCFLRQGEDKTSSFSCLTSEQFLTFFAALTLCCHVLKRA